MVKIRLWCPLALGVAACIIGSTAPATGQTDPRCGAARFTADIKRGPDRDLSLAGRLSIRGARSGPVRGTFVHYRKRLRVTGRIRGRSLRLVIHLRSGRSLTGVGKASRKIISCADLPRRGTATGPRRRDRGDWGWALGG